jgi:hypothetical protein
MHQLTLLHGPRGHYAQLGDVAAARFSLDFADDLQGAIAASIQRLAQEALHLPNEIGLRGTA